MDICDSIILLHNRKKAVHYKSVKYEVYIYEIGSNRSVLLGEMEFIEVIKEEENYVIYNECYI